MDINKGLLYCGNNDDIYRKNLIDFYRDSLRRQEMVKNLVGKDDEQYRIEVHALKGIARNIGAVRLSEMAYLHEEAVTEGNEEYILNHLEKLMNLWNQTMKEIETYVGVDALGDELDSLPKDGVELIPSEAIAAAKLCILHLKHFEEDEAAEALKKVLAHQMPDEQRTIFEKAYREVDDFEYDSAIALLQTLIPET